MSIVRSLLINIGFTTNKKQQKQVLSTINVIKLGFTAAAFAISSAFQRLFSYINELVQFRNQTSDLADSLGLAYSNVLALQRAAINIRVNETQFNSLLNITKELVKNLNFGDAALKKIERELKFNVIDGDTQVDVLGKITKALADWQNRAEAIDYASRIFGQNLAASAIRIGENFDELIEKAKQLERESPSNEEQLKNLEEYNKAYNALNLSIQKLTDTLVTNFIGPLTTSINYLTNVLDFYLNLIKGFVNGDFKPFIETSKKIADNIGIGDWFKSAPNTGVGGMPLIQFPQGLQPFYNNRKDNVRIINNIDVKFPEGTSLEKATESLPYEIVSEIESMIQNTFGNIEFDNPVIE